MSESNVLAGIKVSVDLNRIDSVGTERLACNPMILSTGSVKKKKEVSLVYISKGHMPELTSDMRREIQPANMRYKDYRILQ